MDFFTSFTHETFQVKDKDSVIHHILVGLQMILHNAFVYNLVFVVCRIMPFLKTSVYPFKSTVLRSSGPGGVTYRLIMAKLNSLLYPLALQFCCSAGQRITGCCYESVSSMYMYSIVHVQFDLTVCVLVHIHTVTILVLLKFSLFNCTTVTT